MRRPVLSAVVFLCLPVVLSAQVPISTKREQAPQKQKAGSPPERAESAAFNVGKFPIGVTFDGTNIWVANGGSNTVTRLRASDGAIVGTFSVGEFPIGLAFDGANIWVTNSDSDNVTKLRASDGAVLGNFNVGKAPGGVAFDGTNIWVTNEDSSNVMKLRANDGAVLDISQWGSSRSRSPLTRRTSG